MLRTVIAASLLLTALAVGDLAFWIKHASEGKSNVKCVQICKNLYGTSTWGSGWKRGGAICKCGNGLAVIDIKCTGTSPYSGCKGTQTGGSMKPPPSPKQQPPAGLPAFITQCAHAAKGKYAQKNGKVTNQKVLSGVGDAQCSDLAFNCIRNANLKGFNVDGGGQGSVPGMCGSWAWSSEVVDFSKAKAGDIAQFSSWRQSVTKSDGSWSSSSTGCMHTAVIVKDFDSSSGALEMLDQNPSPVKTSVYYPRAKEGFKKGGKMMVYRLTSVPLKGLPMAGNSANHNTLVEKKAKPAETPSSSVKAAAAGHKNSDFLASQVGKKVSQFDHRAYCTSMGKTYNGYGWGARGGKATIKIHCNGKKEKVVCTYGGGLTIKSCSGPEGGAKHPVPPVEEPPRETPSSLAKAAAAPAAQAPGDYKNTAVQDASCGGLTDKEAQEMLDLHNKMRCAAGAPPIRWNKALACQAQKTQRQIGKFSHSKSFALPISAGENLATGRSMAQAAWMWFTEYTQGDCTKGYSHLCGHFTAMTWKATTEVGCGIGRNDKAFGSSGVIRCQYANAVPNFGNGFKKNVALFKGPKAAYDKCGLSFADAQSNAKKFRSWGILKPTAEFGASLGLYSAEVPPVWVAQRSTVLGAAAIFGAIATFAIGSSLRRWRAPTPEGFEGLDLLPLEAGEVECSE